MKKFLKIGTNQGFTCEKCRSTISPLQNGSIRNHCPFCLSSKHVDNYIGDRTSSCKGIMLPTSAYHHSKKGIMIIHECTKCGIISKNRASLDDPFMPDNYDRVLDIVQQGAFLV